MRTMFTVHHNEHVSSRSFEEVVNAFESAVGSVEDTGFAVLVASTKSAEEFESQVKSRESTSGFMRFLTVDHGAWMTRVGLSGWRWSSSCSRASEGTSFAISSVSTKKR